MRFLKARITFESYEGDWTLSAEIDVEFWRTHLKRCIDIANGPCWSHRYDPEPILLFLQFTLNGSENGKTLYFTIHFHSCFATTGEHFAIQVLPDFAKGVEYVYMGACGRNAWRRRLSSM